LNINEIKFVEDNNLLIIDNHFAEKNNLLFVKQTLLRFGFKSAEIEIKISSSLKENQIEISRNLIEDLKIPTFGNFNLKVENNTIIIGPYIGIILGTKKLSLYRRRRILEPYVKYFNKINGIVVGFTINDMKRRTLEVDGIVYNPNKGVWIRTTVPYPNSIIKRGFVNKKNRQYLFSLYGDKIYNYKAINKWEMHQRLEQFTDLKNYLPDTELYKDIGNMMDFINKYNDIYIKPVGGNQGQGIYNVIQSKDQIRIMTRKDGQNVVITCNSEEEVKEFAKRYLRSRKYIMQQTLDLSINNRMIDFRIGFDKNQQGEWKHNLYITRVGGDESIVSNVATSGGYVEYPQKALMKYYNLNNDMAEEYKKKLLNVGYSIAKKLDYTGVRLGKIALDLCLDNDLNIYLIEVNNRAPNDGLMKGLGDRKTLYDIKLANILYAKGLSGFSKQYTNIYSFSENINFYKGSYKIYIRLAKGPRKRIYRKAKVFIKQSQLLLEQENSQYDLIIKGINTKNDLNTMIHFLKEATKALNTSILIEYTNTSNKGQRRKSSGLTNIKKKLNKLEVENEKLKSENKYLKQSRSWKITAPLRKLLKFFQK